MSSRKKNSTVIFDEEIFSSYIYLLLNHYLIFLEIFHNKINKISKDIISTTFQILFQQFS